MLTKLNKTQRRHGYEVTKRHYCYHIVPQNVLFLINTTKHLLWFNAIVSVYIWCPHNIFLLSTEFISHAALSALASQAELFIAQCVTGIPLSLSATVVLVISMMSLQL